MTMKVSKRDISILCVVIGLLAAFCVYQFYFRKAMDKKNDLDSDTKKLEERLAKLEGVDANVLESTMASNLQDINKKTAVYPAQYRIEDLIMYLDDWQNQDNAIYIFTDYTVTEMAEYDAAASGVIDWDQTTRQPVNGAFAIGSAQIEAAFGTDLYQGFKDLINTIYLDSAPKTVTNVTALMDRETGIIAGSIKMNFFTMLNSSSPSFYTPVKIENVPTSVDNIFGPTFTPTPTPTPTVMPR
ncbi:MAG: hypothetical protein MJ064_03210 [Lachnospiraceae bacterium]|nr:hypothetical protein [Lachnospiraceae bacterium]